MNDTKKKCKPDTVLSLESNGIRRSRRRKHIMYTEDQEKVDPSPTKVASPSLGGREKRSCTAYKIKSVTNDPAHQNREELRHMSRWIEMIIKEKWPLSSVEDEAYRDKIGFSKDIVLQRREVTKVILAMNQLVISKVGSEIKAATRGAIIHSERIESKKYAVGIVASYMVGTKMIRTLIALGEVEELASFAKSDTRNDATLTADSIAEKHAQYIQQQVFSNRYAINRKELQTWLVCQTAITCNAIVKVASLLGVPHVDCHSQLLDKQVKLMFEQTKGATFGVGQLVSEVKEAIKTVEESESSPDELRTFLRTDKEDPMVWTSAATMIAKFNARKSDILRAVHRKDEKMIARCNSLVNSDRATKQAQRMLQNLKFIQQRLKTKGHSLSSCRENIKCLLNYAKAHNQDIESHWFDHKLGTTYIHPSFQNLKDVHFLSGVCKIQRREFVLLNDVEKTACHQMKIPKMTKSQADETGDFKAFVCGSERGSRDKSGRTSIERVEIEYLDCDFICGSASEMEQIWSDARHYKAAQDDVISGALFEAIMMLRYNWRLWDASTVVDAVEYVKSNPSDVEHVQKSKKRKQAI